MSELAATALFPTNHALLPAHPHLAASAGATLARNLHFGNRGEEEIKSFFSPSRLAERLIRTADFAATAASQGWVAREAKMDRRKLAFMYVFGEAGAWGEIVQRTREEPEKGVLAAVLGTEIAELFHQSSSEKAKSSCESVEKKRPRSSSSSTHKTEVAKRLVRACDPRSTTQGMQQLALYLRPVASVVAGGASFDTSTGSITIKGTATDAVAAPVGEDLERVCTVCALRARLSDEFFRETLLPAVKETFPAVLQIWLGTAGSKFEALKTRFTQIVTGLQRLHIGDDEEKKLLGVRGMEKWEDLVEHSEGFPWL